MAPELTGRTARAVTGSAGMRFSSSSISAARTVEFGFDEADRFFKLFLLGIEFQQLSVEIGGRLEQLGSVPDNPIPATLARDVALPVAFQFDLVPVIPDDASDLVLLLDAMDKVVLVVFVPAVHPRRSAC